MKYKERKKNNEGKNERKRCIMNYAPKFKLFSLNHTNYYNFLFQFLYFIFAFHSAAKKE